MHLSTTLNYFKRVPGIKIQVAQVGTRRTGDLWIIKSRNTQLCVSTAGSNHHEQDCCTWERLTQRVKNSCCTYPPPLVMWTTNWNQLIRYLETSFSVWERVRTYNQSCPCFSPENKVMWCGLCAVQQNTVYSDHHWEMITLGYNILL